MWYLQVLRISFVFLVSPGNCDVFALNMVEVIKGHMKDKRIKELKPLGIREISDVRISKVLHFYTIMYG